MILKNLLITPCTQPRLPVRSRYERLRKYPQHDIFPSVQMLRVSKFVNTEATSILYTHNTFAGLSVEENDQLYESLEMHAYRANIVDAVSKIFEPNLQRLPAWLFGLHHARKCSLRDTSVWVYNVTSRDQQCFNEEDDAFGFDFTRFIRQIGPSNAKKIRTVQLTFGDLPRAADRFPIYAEILKQHVTGLQKLIIGTKTQTPMHFRHQFGCRTL